MLTVTTAPATEPVDATLFKEWARVDTGDTSQDNVISMLLTAAREKVEEYTRRTLITTTYTLQLDAEHIRHGEIWLQRPPVQSITSFKTFETQTSGTDAETTVAAADYQLTMDARIIWRNEGWSIARRAKAAEIVYVAGYGSAATDVPFPIREAILRLALDAYELREDRVLEPGLAVARQRLDGGVADTLEPYRFAVL